MRSSQLSKSPASSSLYDAVPDKIVGSPHTARTNCDSGMQKDFSTASATSRNPDTPVRKRLVTDQPPGGIPPSPEKSDSSEPLGSLFINVNSGFVGGVRAALHVIDEGTQLRHHLPVAGIVEKQTRRHGREGFQHADEFPRFHRAGRDRRRQLRKAQSIDGRAAPSRP